MKLEPQAVTGLILAGGQGVRMNHKDKGLVPLKGKLLVEYAVECIRPLVSDIMISCNRNSADYRHYSDRLINDEKDWQFNGPMAGIYSGLKASQTDWLLVSPCDTPLMQSQTMSALLTLQGEQVCAHILADHGWQPLHGLYHRSLLPLLAAQLKTGKSGMQYFLRQLEQQQLQITQLQGEQVQFLNTNDEQELLSMEHNLSD